MFKKNKLLKLVFVNVFVFLGILYFINLAAISIHQLCNLKILKHFYTDPISRLPNYKNIEWAKIHFKECNELQFEYISYIGWKTLPYRGRTINIDERGIRITPQSPLAKSNSPLVVFLGGSAMWGLGADDANTIPALFAQVAKGHYRTINLGQRSYNAFQDYLFLKMQIFNGLKPDIVISYDGVNDAVFLHPKFRPFSHLGENIISEVMEEEKEQGLTFSRFFLGPIKNFISYHKITEDHSRYYSGDPSYFLSNDRIEKTAKALLDGWLGTKCLAERNGAVFIGILQPNAGMGKPYLGHLKLRTDHLIFYKILYSEVLKLLKTPQYEKLSNNVIDLTDSFDRMDYIYIDQCHVSPNGNKIIAEKIYNYINNHSDNTMQR